MNSSNLSQQLDTFIQRAIEVQKSHHQRLPLTQFDDEWPSLCYLGEPNKDGLSQWQPVRQQQHTTQMFERMEEALGHSIHPDLKTWYSRYWSDPIPATCSEGALSLLFVWNEKDSERLRSNLIGHLLNKKKLKQQPSLFFACTEPDSNQILTVENTTGEIWLELPGKKPIRKIANSLAEFVASLTPLPIPDQE
ncbi:MAG: SecY-interacting protein [Amphritea sp.]